MNSCAARDEFCPTKRSCKWQLENPQWHGAMHGGRIWTAKERKESNNTCAGARAALREGRRRDIAEAEGRPWHEKQAGEYGSCSRNAIDSASSLQQSLRYKSYKSSVVGTAMLQI